MRDSYVLEISVETVEAALGAQAGGAHRIELCRELAQGGLTPTAGMMRTVREQVPLPVFVMMRPRGGDFVYADAEFTQMQRDITLASQLGMNGIVLGMLLGNGHVDIARTRLLVEHARPLPVTFHRAFDASADLRDSLEGVIRTGAARILTSGGKRTAPEGLATIAKLVSDASDRITIVPGSGINASNIREVAQVTHAREFHSGLSSIELGPDRNGSRFAAEVRKVVESLTATD
jgi:copper homeostasis protein